MTNATSWARRATRSSGTLLGSIAVALVLFHTLLNALSRRLLGAPIGGTLEYVGDWWLPATVLLGLALAQQRHEHIEATLLFDRMPVVVQRNYRIATGIVTMLAAALFAYFGLLEALDSHRLGLTAGMTGVIVWPVTYLVPIGFALLAIEMLLEVVTVVRAPRDEHDATQEPTEPSLPAEGTRRD